MKLQGELRSELSGLGSSVPGWQDLSNSTTDFCDSVGFEHDNLPSTSALTPDMAHSMESGTCELFREELQG